MNFIIKDKDVFLKKPIVVAALALFCCFLWGSAFVSIKLGYDFFGISNDDIYTKLLFAGTRFLLASLMVFTACILSGNSIKISRSQFKKLLVLGFVQTFLQYMFFYIGLANTSGTNGAILSSTATFFTVALAHFFYKGDRLTKRKILGVSTGFLGIVILNLRGVGGFTMTGEGFVIISSLCAASASIYIKHIVKGIPVFAVAVYQLFVGGALLASIGFIGNGGELLNFNMQGSLILVQLALVSSFAFSLWSTLLKHNDVSRVSIYKFSAPLFGVVLSFILLEERYLNPTLFLAIFFVSAGIIIINTEKG